MQDFTQTNTQKQKSRPDRWKHQNKNIELSSSESI